MARTSSNVIKCSIWGTNMDEFSRLLLIGFSATDLPTALTRLTAAMLAAVLGWALLIAVLASCRPTARWARALTPCALRGVVFTALSGTLVMSPAHAGNDLDGLPLP